MPRGGGPEPPSAEEAVKRRWREQYDLTAAQAEAKWQEFLHLEAYRFHLEEERKLPQGEVDRLVGAKRREVVRGRKW